MKLRRRRFFTALIIAIAIAVACSLAFFFNLFYSIQRQSIDFLFQAAGLHQSPKPEEKIVIVGIDDKSLQQLGQLSGWDRSYHAELINALVQAGARAIVFDILFAEPSSGDKELATSIKDAGDVILPFVYTPEAANSTVIRPAPKSDGLIGPLELFGKGAVAQGYANIAPDADGVVRGLSVVLEHGGSYQPSLALAAVAEYLRRPEIVESPVEDNKLSFAGRDIPVYGANEMLINYTGKTRTTGGSLADFPTASFVDVMDGKADPALFKEKIVIVGVMAAGLGDTFWTPTGEMMYGVEIHAAAMHTILTGNFLRAAHPALTIASILALALICGLVVLRFRILWAALLTAFICFIYFLTAFSFFDNGLVLNMLYPPLTIAGTFVAFNLYNVTSERAEKGEITRTFGRYISPSVVDKILAALSEGGLRLGGEESEVTVAFADIRGFTHIVEEIPPKALVDALNSHLSIIIDAVIKHDGMINKFGGDSVMAIWNAPVESADHALLAIRAASSAQQAILELQRKGANLPRMEFGIGINTGKAIAGNFGSKDRLEYSVIGDTVNTAFRLASATPGGRIWIGENTFAEVKGLISAKQLQPLVVKGKHEPIQAYEVLNIQGCQPDAQGKSNRI